MLHNTDFYPYLFNIGNEYTGSFDILSWKNTIICT